MRVRELLARKPAEVVSVHAAETVGTAVRLLMRRGVGGLVVTDERGALAGFIGERDIVDLLDRHRSDVRGTMVSQVMRRPPTCELDDSVTDVMARMTSERLRHLIVLDGDRPVGVISVGDIVKQRLVELELETGVLRDYVAARRAT